MFLFHKKDFRAEHLLQKSRKTTSRPSVSLTRTGPGRDTVESRQIMTGKNAGNATSGVSHIRVAPLSEQGPLHAGKKYRYGTIPLKKGLPVSPFALWIPASLADSLVHGKATAIIAPVRNGCHRSQRRQISGKTSYPPE